MALHWVVTGAGRGLGLELARQLAAAGHAVTATARDPRASVELGRLDVRTERLDVSDDASVAAFARSLGGRPVDVLVDNAGTFGGREGLEELDLDRLLATFSTNALGPLRVTRALLPNLRAGGRKLVAHVTSKMGSIEDNTSGGAYPYRMSKAALNMFNKSLAVDLAPEGFTCLVLHPGWVRTDMGGSGAPLSAEESVRGMLGVLERATPADSGRFLDHAGETIPW